MQVLLSEVNLLKNRIMQFFVIFAILWLMIGFIDYRRVHCFEMPIFCIGTEIFKDGGSECYVGLGYSFDIEGNFEPEDEFPGITKYTYYLFEKEMRTGIRD